MHTATIKVDKAGQWRYVVKAANGETVAQSEAYTRRWSALRAVRKNHPDVREVRLYNRYTASFRVKKV